MITKWLNYLCRFCNKDCGNCRIGNDIKSNIGAGFSFIVLIPMLYAEIKEDLIKIVSELNNEGITI
jgi:hypothetical protein